MKVASEFSQPFIEGFVEQCQKMGCDCNQTEDLFRKHANTTIISRPDIFEGFGDYIGHYQGPMRKSAIVKWMSPDLISLVEECRIKWGSDLMSQQIRASLGWPEPSWDTIPEEIKIAATDMSQSMESFDHLPLNQKILMAALIGGGAGGLLRGAVPSSEDSMAGRGGLDRIMRGVGRGALAGAGAAVGAGAGSELAGTVGDTGRHGEELPNPAKTPAMLLGGGLGALAGYRLGQ